MLESIMIRETPEYLVRKAEETATQHVLLMKENPSSRDMRMVISKSFELLQLKDLEDKEILILRLHARRALENKIMEQKLDITMQKYKAFENAQYYNSPKPLILGILTTATIGINMGIEGIETLIISTSCGPILGYLAAKVWEGITRQSPRIQYLVSIMTEEYKNIRMIRQDTILSRQDAIKQIQKIKGEDQIDYQGVKIPYQVARKIGWV